MNVHKMIFNAWATSAATSVCLSIYEYLTDATFEVVARSNFERKGAAKTLIHATHLVLSHP